MKATRNLLGLALLVLIFIGCYAPGTLNTDQGLLVTVEAIEYPSYGLKGYEYTVKTFEGETGWYYSAYPLNCEVGDTLFFRPTEHIEAVEEFDDGR